MQKIAFEQAQVLHFPGAAADMVEGLNPPLDTPPLRQELFERTWPVPEGDLHDFLVAEAEALKEQLPPPVFGRWQVSMPTLVEARLTLPLHSDQGAAANINVTVAAPRSRILEVEGFAPIKQDRGDLVYLMGVLSMGQTNRVKGASLLPHSGYTVAEGGFFANISIANPAFSGRPGS